MTAGPAPSLDSEITWLLHRAAQRMHVVTGEQAERHGLQLRDYIVLSALDKTPGLTQVELARALGLDKTTLMTQLDRLEQKNLVVRHSDPRDRRLRIPAITAAGEEVRAQVADASEEAERNAMAGFSQTEVDVFRRMLFAIIGTAVDPGSCL
ncbi:MarR family winged helix-turn-helix transcriptional regulator [Micromonospora foliorum]|uniref:MarR family winged helix-turn-helix transcriptional regulator n=1 Tax=Micromonospora foliorum TaxID=2911210 RepID=UPI001EE843BC|nr:MarR family transcriptional regulator [Micromonospora foliorum]MCG5440248.1 MarR family transcriptional regulator [Micromonospora foliorum]